METDQTQSSSTLPSLSQGDLMGLITALGQSNSQPSSGTDTAVPTGTTAISSDPNKAALQQYAQTQVQQAFPNDPNAWPAFNQIVNMESGWDSGAQNPTSSASGLMQFLSGTGQDYGLPAVAASATPAQQIAAGIQYVKARYSTPSQALQFHLQNGWY